MRRCGAVRLLLLVTGVFVSLIVKADGPRSTEIRAAAQDGATREAAADAQQSLQTPLLGFLASADGNMLLPMLGIPGAAVLGEAVALPEGVAGVHLAPRQEWALLALADGGVAVYRLAGPDAEIAEAVDGFDGVIEEVIFSPSGRYAAIRAAGAAAWQLLDGGAGSVVHEFELAGLDTGPARAVVSDAGAVATATADGAISLISGTGPPRLLHSGPGPVRLAFLPGREDLLILDGRGTLLLIENALDEAPVVRVLDSGIGNPIHVWALAASNDGRWVVFQQAEPPEIGLLDLTSGQRSALPVEGGATRLDPVRTPDVFVVRAERGEAVWVVDMADGPPRTAFVPAADSPDVTSTEELPAGGAQ